jgi:hypothetical protein
MTYINAIAETKTGKRLCIGFAPIDDDDDINAAVSDLDRQTAYRNHDGSIVRAACFEIEQNGQVVGELRA